MKLRLVVAAGVAGLCAGPIGAAENVSPSSGGLSYSIPIELPAYHGLEPRLSLNYSAGGGNGQVGVGWSLSGLSMIQRVGPSGSGEPNWLYTPNFYTLDGEVLLACTANTASAASCTAGGNYTTRSESFVKIQISNPGFYDTGNFTVTGRDGTKTVLTPLVAGVYAPWRWGQSSVTDTKGNNVSYSYTCLGATNEQDCYPSTISYNGYSIGFSLETRPDLPSYGHAGLMAKTLYRVKSVVVKAGSSVIRAYQLGYSTSPATNRSLLTSVQQFGKDAVIDGSGTVTGGTSLPPQTFSYQNDTIAQQFTPTTSGVGTSWCNTALWYVDLKTGDFNGDGKEDLICFPGSGAPQVALSNGTGFDTAVPWGSIGYGMYDLLGDFNGDGKTDIMSPGSSGGFLVGLSTGTTFASSTWNGWDQCSVVQTGDFNGDGLTDVFCREPAEYPNEDKLGYSTGSGFSFVNPNPGHMGVDGPYSIMDYNGDGQADWVGISGGGSYLHLFLNLNGQMAYPSAYSVGCPISEHRWADFNGDGLPDFTCAQSGTVWMNSSGGLLSPISTGSWCTSTTSLLTGDLDGDGRSELICNNPVAPADDIQIRKWTGTGLSSPQTAIASFCDKDLVTGDFNGDGKTDISCRESSTSFAYAGTAAWQADLLATAANGIGGTLTPAYVNSTSFSNQNNPGPRWVVSSLTVADGLGNSATTNYSYSGGYMDREVRKYMGFQFATEDKPANTTESLRPRTVYKFRQDRYAGGKPSSITRLDGADHPLTQQEFTYTTNEGYAPYKSFLADQRSLEWDPAATVTCTSYPCALGAGKRTKASFTYDTYGNVTQQVSHGDEDAGSDEVTTATTFTPNTSLYIVDKPNRTQVFAGVGTGGTLLTDTKISYDGASGYSTAPTAGYPTKIERWLDTDNSWPYRTITYDAYGNPETVTDETNRTITTTYDTTYHTFPNSVANAASETVTAQWDGLCGVPSQTTNPNSQTTTFQTDALCRPTVTSFPLAGFEQRSYTNLGNPATQGVVVETPSATPEDGTGNDWTVAQFDGWGRTFQTVKKGPSPSTPILVGRGYHPRGSVFVESRPFYAGETPVYQAYFYDALDRPTATILPDSHARYQVYGIRGMTAVDEKGKPTVTTYDAYGRQVTQSRILNGQGVTTVSGYDLLGRLVGMQDAIGIQWGWAFDSLGRNTTKADPDAGTWTFAYDAAGRLISQTDAKFQTITFGFDNVGRLTTKTTPGPEVVTTTYSEARTGFFNVGLPTTITSPGSVLKLDYDAVGRPVKQARTLDSTDYVSTRTYDSAGFLRGLSYPDGDSLGPLTYDAAGRLKGVPGILTSVTYNASGQPLVRTNANGTTTTKAYSATRGFLTDIDTVAGSTVIQDLLYSPDPVGLINHVTSPFANESWTYGYDDLYRMTTSTNLSDSNQSQSFSYDAIGRITSNSRIGTYAYPNVGLARPHAPSTAGSNSYSYDNNGNMYSGAGRTLTWDASNRITQAAVGSTTVDFLYDGLDIRLKKTTSSSTSLYPLGDDYEITGGIVTKYVKVEGLGAVAKRVGSGGSIQTFWHHTDRLGSIQAITDVNGALVQRRTYRPYGEKIADSTGHVESEGWIGERNDAETGLQFLHARYYDSALGVFVSPDPIGVAGGLNAYGYGSGNPIANRDRTGWRPDPCRDPETGYVPPECGGSGDDDDPFSRPGRIPYWEPIPWYRGPLGPWRPCAGRNDPTCVGEPDPGPPKSPTGGPGSENPETTDPTKGPGDVFEPDDPPGGGPQRPPGGGHVQQGFDPTASAFAPPDPNDLLRRPPQNFGPRFQQAPYYRPCSQSSAGSRFGATNTFIPGLLAPTGLGLATSGKTAEALRTTTIMRWLRGGLRGMTLGGASFTSIETGVLAGYTAALNFAFAGAGWEMGVGLGSMGGSAGDFWADYLFGLGRCSP